MRHGYDDGDDRSVANRACMNCGAHVTNLFARVMGDNEDRVHGCPQCLTLGELMDGSGGGRGREPEGAAAEGDVLQGGRR